MPLTITLSDSLVTQLQPKAKARKLSLQELEEALLRQMIKADESYPTPGKDNSPWMSYMFA